MTRYAPSLILHNADIRTLNPVQPRARAMAVRGERILELGDDREILMLAGPRTRVLDARGLSVLPGFNDNHVHLLGMGVFLEHPVLFGKNAEEIVATLKRHYAAARPGETVTGYAWDYSSCPHPSKEILDRAFPHNPVILRQYSGHAQWLNSAALKSLLARAEKADRGGGHIMRDESGRPTGIVRGTIVHPNHRRDLLRRAFNLPFHKRLLRRALECLSAAGLTSIQDNTWQPVSVWLLRDLLRAGDLPLRVSCWGFGHYPLVSRAMDLAPYDRTWIRRGPIKYIADGAFSPHTARLLEPYAGEPDNFGQTVLDAEELRRIVRRHARHGRRLAFHVIGDAAARRVIDAVEEAAQAYPYVKRLRYRLEHVQIIHPADILRMKQLGMLASVQPSALALPDRDHDLVGDARFARLYPYRSFLAAGVPLSFGSDIPGEIEYHPLTIIYRAITRRGTYRQGPVYDRAEAVTVAEAVRAYTQGSAYAERMENDKGTLAPGRLADFIVLSDDIFLVDPERIPDTRVVMTVTGGRVVQGTL